MQVPKMLAAIYRHYGSPDVVTLAELPRPVPRDHEILVKVHATTVTAADWRRRAADFPGIFRLPGRLVTGIFAPRHPVLGCEFSGTVVRAGALVTRFSEGDSVFGYSGISSHAEFVTVSETGAVARKPSSVSHFEAAAAPFGALCALIALRDMARLKAGQRVLIAGASGGVGVFAVQLAHHLGAEVTAVCSSANADLVRSLGADRVIDYEQTQYWNLGESWDLILDTAGISNFAQAKRALTPRGIFLPLEFAGREIMQALATRIFGGRRVIIGITSGTQKDMGTLSRLLAGGIIRPVIDRVLPFNRIADAHRLAETRHKHGSVVIAVDSVSPLYSAAIVSRLAKPCGASPASKGVVTSTNLSG